MKQPLVSVVMSVFNAGPYLKEAVNSILGQSYSNFEFIIIDDGSMDDSLNIIKSYKDKRIRFKSRSNKGLPASLNEAIGMARGKYIARMDQDDISQPQRLRKQINYLERHPEIGLLGTQITIIDEKGDQVSKEIAHVDLLTHPDDLKLAGVFSNQFVHGSAMIRRAVLDNVGLYDSSAPVSAEDYDLWARISHITGTANLNEQLYSWRLHSESLSKYIATADKVQQSALKTAAREFEYYLAHSNEYKFFVFHPFSMSGGAKYYLLRKSALYRDMALMYSRHGRRRRALPIALLATAHAPWLIKNYRQLVRILVSHSRAINLDYELF